MAKGQSTTCENISLRYFSMEFKPCVAKCASISLSQISSRRPARNGRSSNTVSTGKSKCFKAGSFRTTKIECACTVILFGSTDGLRDSYLTSICDSRSSSNSTTLITDLEIPCTSQVFLFYWAGVLQGTHSTSLCMRTFSSDHIQSPNATAILTQDLCVVGPLLGDARFLRTIKFDHASFVSCLRVFYHGLS